MAKIATSINTNNSQPMRCKLAIQSTVYPLDYNRNNPSQGFNEWMDYIQVEADLIYASDRYLFPTQVKEMKQQQTAKARRAEELTKLISSGKISPEGLSNYMDQVKDLFNNGI